MSVAKKDGSATAQLKHILAAADSTTGIASSGVKKDSVSISNPPNTEDGKEKKFSPLAKQETKNVQTSPAVVTAVVANISVEDSPVSSVQTSATASGATVKGAGGGGEATNTLKHGKQHAGNIANGAVALPKSHAGGTDQV